MPDSIEEWASRYLDAAPCGVASVEVPDKIALHPARFRDNLADAHGHVHLSAVVRRQVIAWRDYLAARPQSPDVNGVGPGARHRERPSGQSADFNTWGVAAEPAALAHGNPCAKVADLPVGATRLRLASASRKNRSSSALDGTPSKGP